MSSVSSPHPVVEEAAPADWRPVAAALAAAFTADPVWSWLIPHGARRPAALQRFFAIEARRIALRHRRSTRSRDGAGTTGAALVLPPGRWRTPVHVQARFGPRYAQVFGRRLPHALNVLTQMERRHLREPHVYLAYIGVLPQAQGTGIGRALMQPVLQRCDRDGLPAYLEASSPRNAQLYERLGFVATQTIRPGGSPPIQLMVRPPASG